ncbi:hypothetical protein D3P06_01060 [Paracoccus aestuarii]|uniref:Phasin domain-containing protein n=2 Tax=Paracoccus aestuarii TaxID=453842 RepID=A0A419A2P9_9RHOB|nr:hypothetical protein D3P06_01060 [Paracoccus aestuarii]
MEMKEAMTTETERLNAITAWWGLPFAGNSGAIDHNLRLWQGFAVKLQKICADAYDAEVNAVSDRTGRLGQSFQALMQCRNPNDLLSAQAQMVAVIHEGASLRAKRWSELSERLHDCCASIAQDAANDLNAQVSEKEQQATKPGRRQAN